MNYKTKTIGIFVKMCNKKEKTCQKWVTKIFCSVRFRRFGSRTLQSNLEDGVHHSCPSHRWAHISCQWMHSDFIVFAQWISMLSADIGSAVWLDWTWRIRSLINDCIVFLLFILCECLLVWKNVICKQFQWNCVSLICLLWWKQWESERMKREEKE